MKVLRDVARPSALALALLLLSACDDCEPAPSSSETPCFFGDDCEPGEVCAAQDAPELVFACEPRRAEQLDNEAPCDRHSACESGLCLPSNVQAGPDLAIGFCATACEGDVDCPAGAGCHEIGLEIWACVDSSLIPE